VEAHNKAPPRSAGAEPLEAPPPSAGAVPLQERRLPLWQAAVWVLLGGSAAQLAGGFVSSLLRFWLGTHAGASARLDASGLGTNVGAIVPAMLASACMLIGVALFAPSVSGVPLSSALNLRRASVPAYLAAALGTVMLSPTADTLMRAMQSLWPDLSLGVVALLHDLVRRIPLLVAWPVFALMPGISEELMFRGLLQSAARRRQVGILVSGLAFSLFHLDPQHIAGVLPLGFFLAWVGSRSGTWVTIFAHVVNNTAAIAAVHIAALDVGYGTDAPMPWPWVPASLLLCGFSVLVIAKHHPLPPGGVPCSDLPEF
jgi:membrane protease YdiL (CAAX protease family)